MSSWDDERGTPLIHIRKRDAVDIPLESLSTGEEELLSLTTSLYVARDRTDVYLIDEPEVHLNWHLEERLFGFLDDLCERFGKQAIVVTHSRAMFKPRYQPKTIFLSWLDDDTVAWSRKLTPEQYRRIAGDAIEVIGLGDFSRPTFFVEDGAHTVFVGELARILEVDVTISECGNASNVKSLFRLSQRESGWENSFFLVDGDNQGSPFKGERHYIHLPVYCSDNYLIHPGVLAAVGGITELAAQELIHAQILAQRTQILKKNRFFEFLMDGLQPDQLTFDRLATLDASLIVVGVAEALGKTQQQLSAETLAYLSEQGRLTELLPEELVSAFTAYQLDQSDDQDPQKNHQAVGGDGEE